MEHTVRVFDQQYLCKPRPTFSLDGPKIRSSEIRYEPPKLPVSEGHQQPCPAFTV